MKTPRRSLALGALAATAVACAHGPAPMQAERSERTAIPEKVFVTGSHIAQRADPVTGVPMPTSAVKIYDRNQLLRTGQDGDLRAALRSLDPSLSP